MTPKALGGIAGDHPPASSPMSTSKFQRPSTPAPPWCIRSRTSSGATGTASAGSVRPPVVDGPAGPRGQHGGDRRGDEAALARCVSAHQRRRPASTRCAQRRAGRGRRRGQHVGDRGELVAGPVARRRGRSPAASMACHPAASTMSGRRPRTSLSSAAGLRSRVGEQARVVVGDQFVHGLQRARLVGADEARRAALDPARDIAAAHRLAGLRIDDPAAVVGHHRGGRRRTAGRESACRGSRLTSAPGRRPSGASRRCR